MDPTKVSIAVAFDAHVLKWSLDNNPPDEYARHHIKEASIYGHNVWTADFTVKIPEGSDGKIKFNYVGINEKAMWPAKKAQKEEGGRGKEEGGWGRRREADEQSTNPFYLSSLYLLSSSFFF